MEAVTNQQIIEQMKINEELRRNYQIDCARVEQINKVVEAKELDLQDLKRKNSEIEQILSDARFAIQAKQGPNTNDLFLQAYFDMLKNKVIKSSEATKGHFDYAKSTLQRLQQYKERLDHHYESAEWLEDYRNEEKEVKELELKLEAVKIELKEKKERYNESLKQLAMCEKLGLNTFIVECCKNAAAEAASKKKIARLLVTNAKLASERDVLDMSISSQLPANEYESQPIVAVTEPEKIPQVEPIVEPIVEPVVEPVVEVVPEYEEPLPEQPSVNISNSVDFVRQNSQNDVFTQEPEGFKTPVAIDFFDANTPSENQNSGGFGTQMFDMFNGDVNASIQESAGTAAGSVGFDFFGNAGGDNQDGGFDFFGNTSKDNQTGENEDGGFNFFGGSDKGKDDNDAASFNFNFGDDKDDSTEGNPFF